MLTPAAGLAFLAGALGVVAAYELLRAVEQAAVARAAARVLGPLAAARREGREPTAPERRRLAVVGALALLAGGWLVAGPLAAVVAGAAGPFGVQRLLAWRRARWRAELARGAPAAARAIADALAGGHAVTGAIAAAAGGVPGAAGRELRDAARAFELGSRTEDVLERLRRRAGDPTWDTIVAAILLQRRAGGDLAALLRGVAVAQEDAARVEQDARSQTAQARFTAWLVALLPTLAAVLAELASPGYLLELLRRPVSAVALALALLLQAGALVLIRRLARPSR